MNVWKIGGPYEGVTIRGSAAKSETRTSHEQSHTYPSEPEGHRTQKRPRFREIYWDFFIKFYDVRVHILFSIVRFASFIGRFKLGRSTQNRMFSFWRAPFDTPTATRASSVEIENRHPYRTVYLNTDPTVIYWTRTRRGRCRAVVDVKAFRRQVPRPATSAWRRLTINPVGQSNYRLPPPKALSPRRAPWFNGVFPLRRQCSDAVWAKNTICPSTNRASRPRNDFITALVEPR